MIEFLQYPLALVVTLGVLISFHEFGHFVVARWSGVRVVRFSIGFGRPLLQAARNLCIAQRRLAMAGSALCC